MARRIAVVCIFIAAANFMIFLWETKFSNDEVTQRTLIFSKRGAKASAWPTLDAEIGRYLESGYDLGWLDRGHWPKIRKVLGDYAPFVELVALRGWGMAINMVFFLAFIVMAVFEGRVAYNEKMVRFTNVSSTKYHLFFRHGLSFMVIFLLTYLTFPFGSDIPKVCHIPATIDVVGFDLWLSSPMTWLIAFSPLWVLTAYQVSSNFSRNI